MWYGFTRHARAKMFEDLNSDRQAAIIILMRMEVEKKNVQKIRHVIHPILAKLPTILYMMLAGSATNQTIFFLYKQRSIRKGPSRVSVRSNANRALQDSSNHW